MKIVIAGAGEVGTHLAIMLNNEHHDMIIIDDDPRRLEEVAGISDIVCIEGDCTLFSVLNKSMVRKADLFIAVCRDENANILASIIAKQLGAKKCITRIDNIEYMLPNNKKIFINIGIDYLFYPERVVATEVINLLGHTRTTEYVDFAGGKLSLLVFKLSESSVLIDRTFLQVTPNREFLDYRTLAISRDGEMIIPHGNDVFKVGDTLYVITKDQAREKVMEFSGEPEVDVKNIMILGGSRIGIGIAKTLQHDMNVKLVEYNPEKAYKLAELLDETLIVHEDGRNTDAMLEEGLDKMDAFVAVTGRAETNILTAMLAKRLGVKKVIAEVENMNYIDLAESIGIDTIINKKLIIASSIFRFTMSTDVQSVKCLTGSDAEVMEFIAKPNSLVTKNKIRELDFPKESLIGGIVRGDNAFIAHGGGEIKPYDRVVVFALPSAIPIVGKFFN